MSGLKLQTKDTLIASRLIKAQSLKQRCIGLIGRKVIDPEEVFWIPSAPSIHTFFMQFPIDVIFTDKNFIIVKLFEDVQSKRILFGGWKASHVFEMASGQIQKLGIKKGDKLYVES